MSKITDKQEVSFAIDRHILAMSQLKAWLNETSVETNQEQADSAEDYCRVVEKIMELHGDLLRSVMPVVARFGPNDIHPTDLRAFGTDDDIGVMLDEVRDYIQELVSDREAA